MNTRAKTRRLADVPAWSDAGALASKDFAEFTEDEIARRAFGPRLASRGRPASAGHGGGCPGAARASTSGGRWRAASGQEATLSGCRAVGGVPARDRSSSSATSAARWNVTPGCSFTSRMPSGNAIGEWRRSFSRPSSRGSRARCASAGSTPRSRLSVDRCRTGRGAREPVKRSGSSINAGHVECCTAAPWCCSSPTDGTAAILTAPRSDRPAPAELPSAHLAEPAHRHGGLRAAHARTAGRAAIRRRLPSGANAEQPRGSGGTT